MADKNWNDDGNDDGNLEALLQGDNFLSEEQRAEEAATQRRLARKRRLQTLSADEPIAPNMKTATEQQPKPPPPQPPHMASSNDPIHNNDGSAAIGAVDGEGGAKDDYDMFDIFSSSLSPPYPNAAQKDSGGGEAVDRTKNKGANQRDFDDSEGYYKAAIGEIIPLELGKGSPDIETRVQGIIGKGVFSSVLKCSVTPSPSAAFYSLPPQVALKCIRSNDTMTKSAHSEIKFLQRLLGCPGIIQLYLPSTNSIPSIEHHGHTILVFPYEPYNLRDVLIKFGKGVGLSLTAVKSFFGQLLAAATHLTKHKILHADLKPDNLLVSQDYSQILLADFGSAIDFSDSSTEVITPYLASRFYRAPEIMLGLPPSFGIDLWSLAVTAAEIFLGKVLFQGSTNNDMLLKIMQDMGPVSNRMIRSHLLQAKKNPIPTHFTQVQANYFFCQESIDTVLGQAVHKEISLDTFKPSLQSKVLKARSPRDSRTQVLLFSDLLIKCLTIDPSRRISVKAALQHDFFKEETNGH